LGIVLIIIIGYQFAPKLSDYFYALTNSDVTSAGLSNVNLTSTDDSNVQDPATSSIQNPPSTYNITSSSKDEFSTGYWIVFVLDGTLKQLSININENNYLQSLIEKDSKESANNKIFLIDNGRIRQYMVSNEIYSVISNMAAIYSRTLNSSSNTSSDNSPNSAQNATTGQ